MLLIFIANINGHYNRKYISKVLNECVRKPKKIWVDQCGEFCNRSMKLWLHKNSNEMYSIHNDGKSVTIEKFIKILKTKIYKHMTVVSKSVYIDRLNEIVDIYNNAYYRTIKMKPAGVIVDTYINYVYEHKKTDPKFKVGNHVRVLKYFCKGLYLKLVWWSLYSQESKKFCTMDICC